MDSANRDEITSVLFRRINRHIGMLILNRPDARNAVNGEMAEEIERLVAALEDDPEIRVGIIAGNGKSFCAGADLKEIAAGRALTMVRSQTGFAGFTHATKSIPWIAAVNGAAHGGGAEIALSCDMIVAGDDASFALPEVQRGAIAGSGGCYRLAQAIPKAIATEFVLTGAPILADRAFETGLVNRVVSAKNLRNEAIRLAETIAMNSPVAVRESLSLVKMMTIDREAYLRNAQLDALERVHASNHMIEGANAFVEKRKPIWPS